MHCSFVVMSVIQRWKHIIRNNTWKQHAITVAHWSIDLYVHTLVACRYCIERLTTRASSFVAPADKVKVAMSSRYVTKPRKTSVEDSAVKSFDGKKWLRASSDTRRPDPMYTAQITQAHKKILLDTWRDISQHLDDSGTRIFLEIFSMSPTVRDVFSASGAGDGEMLQLHATRFMEALGAGIENIDKLATVVAPMFINLGRRHILFDKLREDYFDRFRGAMMLVFREDLGKAFTNEIRRAWAQFTDYLLQHIKFGYQMALKDRKQEQKEREEEAGNAAQA